MIRPFDANEAHDQRVVPSAFEATGSPAGHGDPASAHDAAGPSGYGQGAPIGGASGISMSAPRRARSRSLLRLGLGVWDVLIPAALLMLTYPLAGSLAEPWGGGAAAGTSWLALVLGVLSPVSMAMAGGYRERRRRAESRLLFAGRLLVIGALLMWIATILAVAGGWRLDLSQVLIMPVALTGGWLLGRWACDRHPAARRDRVLLVGSGAVAQRVLDLTERHRERRLHVIGRLDDAPLPMGDDAPPCLGALADLEGALERHQVDRVIVAFSQGRDEELLDVLRRCSAAGVQVDVVPRFFDLVGPAPHAYSLGGLSLVEVPSRGLTVTQRFAKRALDLVGSSVLLLVTLPVMAAVALVIAADDGLPVLFRQTRVGRGGRSFRILKFRTMRTGADRDGIARAAALADEGEIPPCGVDGISAVVREMKPGDDPRLTRAGHFLRRSSLDELPQLINVLTGRMSLVGPRPLRPFEASSLDEWQLARQELRPGLTGLWQVLGRSEVEWDERMQLDYTYVAHWSFLFDLRILARTIPAVLTKDGAV